MKEVAYQKNMLLSSLLNESLEQQIDRFQGENTFKAQLAFLLLTRNEKKEEFEEIHDCINAVKKNIASGNYRMALRILALTQKKINRFHTEVVWRSPLLKRGAFCFFYRIAKLSKSDKYNELIVAQYKDTVKKCKETIIYIKYRLFNNYCSTKVFFIKKNVLEVLRLLLTVIVDLRKVRDKNLQLLN